jgi:hypothetical protein
MKCFIRRLIEKIELSLLKAIIPLMTDAHPVGICIQYTYRFIEGQSLVLRYKYTAIWLTTGLAVGFALGLFRSVLWN